MQLDDSVKNLRGIGEKTAENFEKLGILSIRDLIGYFPRDYKEYSNPVPVRRISEGDRAAVFCQIVRRPVTRQGRRMKVTVTSAADGTGSLQLVWFNRPYLSSTIRAGDWYVLYGRVHTRGSSLQMENPEIYTQFQYQKLLQTWQPVYTLTKGVTNRTVLKAVRAATPLIEEIRDPLPEDLCADLHLMKRRDAILALHFPENQKQLGDACRRTVFDEFLIFLLQVRELHRKHHQLLSHVSLGDDTEEKVLAFLKDLPFSLTTDQRKVLREIAGDLSSGEVMSRLVQGDVGSGKTVVAAAALYAVISSGYQGALMAPTEALAMQHYQNFQKMFGQTGLRIRYLAGSVPAGDRKIIYQELENGICDMVIGTHALIQDSVKFHDLGMAVMDEQHRFGVKQREKLLNKGENPHGLYLSATPIPRTLAMILYADMKVSSIHEMPAGRKRIRNCVVGKEYREKSWHFILREVQAGHQAYVVCPMIEESETLDAENVLSYAEKMQQELGSTVRTGVLHGKMKENEKERVLQDFRDRKLDVLVSTTVIEVGIDNPNATVMMIENAERFGLSQLHQLRGRVGRGDAQSYCIFMNIHKTKESSERLRCLEQSDDGFWIAEQDLKFRGPGELFGVRQSGDFAFRYADIYRDADLLEMAQKVSVTDRIRLESLETWETKEKGVDDSEEKIDSGDSGPSGSDCRTGDLYCGRSSEKAGRTKRSEQYGDGFYGKN